MKDGRRTPHSRRREKYMREELEDMGVILKNDTPVKDVERVYRNKTKKSPPSYNDKISIWLSVISRKKKK